MGWFNFFNRKSKAKTPPWRVVEASVLRSSNDTENQSFFASAKDSSADDICSSAERSDLRAKCRKIQLDCPNAANAARSLALSVYGSGPSLQLKTAEESLNASIENLFNQWRKQTLYDTKFFTAIQSLPCDGESFFHTYEDPYVLGGINVELIEPYRIESKPGLGFQPDVFCGIKYDEFNRPIEYSIRKVNQNPEYFKPLEFDIVPASRIEHLYIPLLQGQRRGLPLLQSAIQTLASLKKIEDSTLSAVETAANISFVVESDLDPNVDTDSQLCGVEGASGYEAFDVVKLPTRNSGLYLPSGMKANQFKPEQPSVNYAAFKEDCLLGVGGALGAPKNIILNDSSSYNYSSARLDAQVFERWATIIQSLCIRVLDSHLRTFLSAMIDNPEVSRLLSSYSTLDDIPYRWYFAQPTHIDRQKEASADVLLLTNNCMSLREFYAKQGKDWRGELEQIALERKMIRELGLTTEEVTNTIQQDENKGDVTE